MFSLKKTAGMGGQYRAGGWWCRPRGRLRPPGRRHSPRTNIASAVSGPIGCGSLQLGYNTKGTLDLAGGRRLLENAPVTVQADSQSREQQRGLDRVRGQRFREKMAPAALGEFVAMFTPLGKIPSFTHVSGPGTSGTNAAARSG